MTLNEIKEFLQIYFDDDDNYLNSLIQISEIYIDKCCGNRYKSDEKLVKLAELVQKKLINDMYENRSTNISNKFKRDIMVTTIFDLLSNVM